MYGLNWAMLTNTFVMLTFLIGGIFVISFLIALKRYASDKKPDQQSESAELLKRPPPFFPGDKVLFLNGNGKLHPGTVLSVVDNPTDKGHQRVTIKFLSDPKDPTMGFGEKTCSSRKVILAKV